MDAFKKGWFSELSELWPGQAMSLQVEEVLLHEKSRYQDVMVFRSKTHGNVLILDGVIQCTEKDEFSYQEMMAHIPLNSHPDPKKWTVGLMIGECWENVLHQVLIIGGGDGGVLREVVKHPFVETVDQCEIDEKVIEVSKKYLPHMACGYDSPKVNLHIGDGFDFMKKHKGEYDVIITDSSDPVGPASSLFQKSYYELMKAALKPDGILCCQGECLWLHLNLIKEMLTFCRTVFPVSDYAFTTIPTYPSGQIGFILCSSNPDTNFKEPVTMWGTKELKILKLKYYNSDVHRAAFTLPQFAKEVLFEAEDDQATNCNGIVCNNVN